MGINLCVHCKEAGLIGKNLDRLSVEHSVTIVEGQDEVVVAEGLFQNVVKFFRSLLMALLVGDLIDLEHFLEGVVLHETAFHNGRLAGKMDEGDQNGLSLS